MKTDEQILDEVRRSSAGLLVMSESDYPFEIIRWDGEITITPEYLREISDRAEDSPIEVTDVNAFFNSSGGIQSLGIVLKNNLADIKVYKVGSINIPVYIVGRSPEGNWLGLSTRLVQT